MCRYRLVWSLLFLIVGSHGRLLAQAADGWLPSDSSFFDQLDVAPIRTAVAVGDFNLAAKRYLQFRRKESPVKWTVMPPRSPQRQNGHEPAADSVLDHFIKDDFHPHPYVKEAVFMGKEFDWKFNPLGRSNPSFSHQWTYVVISRMEFWGKLADAYRRTLDEKYAAKWVWFLHDFARDNPLKAYVGKEVDPLMWQSLDVALRMLSSWPNAYFTFRDSPSFGAADQLLYAKLMYVHAMRLQAALAHDPDRVSNWITRQASALYTISVLFPEFRQADAWRKAATDRLEKQIRYSFTPEGFQAELSPSYHFGALATFRKVADLTLFNDRALPNSFLQRLKEMYRAPISIMDQNGGAVWTNDSNPRDIRSYAKSGLELGSDPLLAWAASNGRFGKAPPTATALHYAGFYAMRSGWKPDDLYLFFRGGPTGIAHAEEDMLQVVLRAWGTELLLEPGKYAYDQSEWRRYAINTPSHNTIIVDGKWQHRGATKGAIDQPTGNPWITNPLFDFVSATYDEGYETNVYDPNKQYQPERWLGDRDTTVKHTRKVMYIKPYYALVFDELDGSGEHTYDAHFHLNAPAAAIDTLRSAVFTARTDKAQLALYALDGTHLQTAVLKGQKSPMLGWIPSGQKAIPTVRFRKVQEAPASFATLLVPYRNDRPVLNMTDLPLEGANVWSKRMVTGGEELELSLVRGNNNSVFQLDSKFIGTASVEASGLLIRKLKNSEAAYIGAWNLDKIENEAFSLSVDMPSDLVFKPLGNRFLVYTSTANVTLTVTKPFKKTYAVAENLWYELSAKGMKKVGQPTDLILELQ